MVKPGDVVLIKMHPASGQELKKFRPAIVLQQYPLRDFVTFIPLSSLTSNSTKSELLIPPSSVNGLDKPSLALCWYVQTVGAKRIQKVLGKLSSAEYKKVTTLTRRYLIS